MSCAIFVASLSLLWLAATQLTWGAAAGAALAASAAPAAGLTSSAITTPRASVAGKREISR